jgi:hypothetical protein
MVAAARTLGSDATTTRLFRAAGLTTARTTGGIAVVTPATIAGRRGDRAGQRCSAGAGDIRYEAQVPAEEVDEYLSGVREPKRSTLQALRRTILEIVPDALHFRVDRSLPRRS